MSKASALRDQTAEELLAREEECRASLFRLRNESRNPEKGWNTNSIADTRKEIARLKTVLREKKGTN